MLRIGKRGGRIEKTRDAGCRGKGGEPSRRDGNIAYLLKSSGCANQLKRIIKKEENR